MTYRIYIKAYLQHTCSIHFDLSLNNHTNIQSNIQPLSASIVSAKVFCSIMQKTDNAICSYVFHTKRINALTKYEYA